VTIRINAKIVEQAKEQGFNISKVCENALKQKLTLKQPQFCGEAFFPKKVLWWAGQDLNLRPQPRKGCVLTRLDDRPLRLPPIGYTDVY
jgi:hypothetical protein